MTYERIEQIVMQTLTDLCESRGIDVQINKQTPLIGSQRVLDSLGLVNLIVDVETAFLDEDVEIALSSESAMSSRISPFRSIGSLCNFIAKQLGLEQANG